MRKLISQLKQKVNLIKKDMVIIYYALQDKRTPLIAKCFGVLAIAYLLSPIDLIPDFIPVIGLLDDLIIVPALILITVKLIPKALLVEIKSKVDSTFHLKKKWYYAIPIVLIYILILFWLWIKYFTKN